MTALIFALCLMIESKTDRSSDYLRRDQTVLQRCDEHEQVSNMNQ